MKRKSDRHRERRERERERERGRWILIRRDGWPRDISRRCKSLRHGRTSVRSPSPTQRPCGGAAAANPLRTSFIQTWRLPALLCVDLLYFQCCSIELSKIFLIKKKENKKVFPFSFFARPSEWNIHRHVLCLTVGLFFGGIITLRTIFVFRSVP